jgi:hypothetical protein
VEARANEGDSNITIHRCEDGLTSNTPKMLGRIFGDELYQTKVDKIVKNTLLDYQRIVSDEPIIAEKWALKYVWNLVPDIMVMSLRGQ